MFEVACRHGFPGFPNPGRGAVPVMPVVERSRDRLDKVSRGPEAKGDRVANVQIPYFRAGGLHSLRLNDDITNSVGKPLDPGRSRTGSVGEVHARIFSRRHWDRDRVVVTLLCADSVIVTLFFNR